MAPPVRPPPLVPATAVAAAASWRALTLVRCASQTSSLLRSTSLRLCFVMPSSRPLAVVSGACGMAAAPCGPQRRHRDAQRQRPCRRAPAWLPYPGVSNFHDQVDHLDALLHVPHGLGHVPREPGGNAGGGAHGGGGRGGVRPLRGWGGVIGLAVISGALDQKEDPPQRDTCRLGSRRARVPAG